MRMYRPEYLGREISEKEYYRMLLNRVLKEIRENRLWEKKVVILDVEEDLTKICAKIFEKFDIEFKISEEKGNVIPYPLEDYLNFCLKELLFGDVKNCKKYYFPFRRILREEIVFIGRKLRIEYKPKEKELDWFIKRFFEMGPTIPFSFVNGIDFLVNNS